MQVGVERGEAQHCADRKCTVESQSSMLGFVLQQQLTQIVMSFLLQVGMTPAREAGGCPATVFEAESAVQAQ